MVACNAVTIISSSSVTTRGAVPGLSNTDPQAGIAARLGRINANVKIAAMLDDSVSLQASFKELAKLTGANASELTSSNTALDIINVKASKSSFKTTFDAAEAIQLAQITARQALKEGQASSKTP